MATTTSGRDADDAGLGRDGRMITGTSRWQKVVGIAGLVVVLWVGSELYDVIFYDGSGFGGGQHAPADNQDQDGDPTPPSTGPHDPSRFRH